MCAQLLNRHVSSLAYMSLYVVTLQRNKYRVLDVYFTDDDRVVPLTPDNDNTTSLTLQYESSANCTDRLLDRTSTEYAELNADVMEEV